VTEADKSAPGTGDRTDVDDAGDSADAFLYEVIDDLIAQLAEPACADALRAGRERFEARRGRVREDEGLWELWTQSFLECFCVEGEDSPAALALQQSSDARVRQALDAWLRSWRALVEVQHLGKGVVRVRDLLRGGLFEVSEKRSLHGVDAGDLAEVRLIGFEGQVRFGRSFLYHPSGTRDILAEQVAGLWARGSDDHDILDHCARLRLRTERYRHVAPERLYRAATEEL